MLLLALLTAPAAGGEVFDDQAVAFLQQVETRELGRLGVLYRGRVAVLDTVAREQLDRIGVGELPAGVSPVAAYLELYLNAGGYLDRPVVAVGEGPMRVALGKRLQGATAQILAETDRLPPVTLVGEEALGRMLSAGRAGMDDYRRAGSMPSLEEPLVKLSGRPELRLPLGRLRTRYEAWLGRGLSDAACIGDGNWASVDAVLAGQVAGDDAVGAWRGLRDAWQARDAAGVRGAGSRLTKLQAGLAGAHYPSPLARTAEIAYNRLGQFTFTWVGFAAAAALLVPATVRRGGRLRRAGLGLLALSTVLLGAGFAVRWVISGRGAALPPILNEFEAVTGSALLAALVAIALEVRWKRGTFALAGSFYAAVAMLCGFWMPGRMGAAVAAPHGILDSPLMAAHVGVIIVAHAMVGMTFVISAVYLIAASRVRDRESRTLREVDRCNLIVVHVATWTLALGTALGAAWGDGAWGRGWGWDAKETWALITLLVYVGIVHVRLVTPPRRRGAATAIGCVIGTAVMLFNWIVVNYYLTRMHGYA
jgi:ABC-type transport system involved in cytochrome c biogenesis permease subunit